MPSRKSGRPSREQGRLVLRLLRDLVPVVQWLGPERAAVTAFHLWAHGAPPNLDTPPRGPAPDLVLHDDPIRAGDRPTPLPSEVLESVDGGRGIAGWIITPADLDRLSVLSRDPGDGNGDRIDGAPIGEVQYPDGSRTTGYVAAFDEVVDDAADQQDDPRLHMPEPDGVKSPHPIAQDPRRPSLDHYPEDALLLTYREVRRLLALHIGSAGDSVLSWSEQARAMREGETPLRIAEVLDR